MSKPEKCPKNCGMYLTDDLPQSGLPTHHLRSEIGGRRCVEGQLAERTAERDLARRERDAEKAGREKAEAEVTRLRILEGAVRAYRDACTAVNIAPAGLLNLQLAGEAMDAALCIVEAAKEKR
jgi:hypothetical protein